MLEKFIAEGRRTRHEVLRVAWAIRAFLRYLFEVDRRLKIAPVGSPLRGPTKISGCHAISAMQLSRILSLVNRGSVHGKKVWAVLALLVNYGLRIGEVAGLRRDEVNWEDRLLRVRRSKTGGVGVSPHSWVIVAAKQPVRVQWNGVPSNISPCAAFSSAAARNSLA